MNPSGRRADRFAAARGRRFRPSLLRNHECWRDSGYRRSSNGWRRFDGSRRQDAGPDLRNEPVALAGDRLDVRRRIGGIAQRLANLADRRVDPGLDVHEDIGTPQPLDDVGPRDQLAWPFGQEDEQVHRLATELDPPPLPAQLVGRAVELELAETQDLRGWWVST